MAATDGVTVERATSLRCVISAVESQLVEVLGLPPNRFAVTLCSSGMAAADEQLRSLPGLRVVRSDEYEARALLRLAREHRPHVVFDFAHRLVKRLWLGRARHAWCWSRHSVDS